VLNVTYMQSTLELSGYKIPVKIGWTEDERQHPQLIQFDLRLQFQKLPDACQTDDLKDTLCYFTLSQKINDICSRTEYRLIEKLGFEIYQTLTSLLPPSVQLKLTITKLNPPLAEVISGATASFSLGE